MLIAYVQKMQIDLVNIWIKL